MTLNNQWLKKPQATTEEMKRLYESGLSSEQIAKQFGMSKSSISRRLRKAGVPLRSSSDYEGSKRYWLWKDLDTNPIERKRNQRKHRKWSHAVLERDGNTCQDCGITPSESNLKRGLHAHHIVALKDCINSSLEFDVSNGVTLCPKCHKQRHKLINEKSKT